jgi:hypothetical protein
VAEGYANHYEFEKEKDKTIPTTGGTRYFAVARWVSIPLVGLPAVRYSYPDGGESITIELHNGTTVRVPWFVNVFGEWSNTTSGADIFRRRCLTEILGNNPIVTPPPVAPRFLIGYPNPLLAVSAEGLSSAYLLSIITAIIVIHSFSTVSQTTGLG